MDLFWICKMYLCPARIFVIMKSFEELSDAELSRLWNAVERNVNEIEITEKDVKAVTDFEYGIDRIMSVVERASDEMGVTVDISTMITNHLGMTTYSNAYYTFVDSFVERALSVFIERVKKAFY